MVHEQRTRRTGNALLTDPYVIVHSAMLRALPGLGLPDKEASELLSHFATWAQHYSDKDERRLRPGTAPHVKLLDGIRSSALWARAAVESLADPE
jgi:hypothetical protein